MIERYAHYVETVGRAYRGLVRYWLTFNEINSVALSYLNAGVTLEDERDRAAVTAAFSHHMFMASARAVEILHKIDPANKVGCMVAAGATYPYRCAPEDVWLAYEEGPRPLLLHRRDGCGAYPAWKLRALEKEGVHVPFEPGDTEYLAEHTVDFISFSYYCSRLVCADDQVIAEKAEGNVFPTLRNPYLKDKETARSGRSMRWVCA